MSHESNHCGLHTCFLICMMITLVIACITYYDGCISELDGMCPRYIPKKGTIAGFHYKKIEKTDSEGGIKTRYDIFADIKINDDETCRSALYKNRKSLPTTINVNTTEIYDFKVGRMYDTIVLKEHQDWCVIDVNGKFEANGIGSIIMFAFFGGMGLTIIFQCIRKDNEECKTHNDVNNFSEYTKKIIRKMYVREIKRPASPKIIPICENV